MCLGGRYVIPFGWIIMSHCYQEIVDGYQGIFAQLRKAPKDIEEVATMRELGNLRICLVLYWESGGLMGLVGLNLLTSHMTYYPL